jgi:hypothetical protein
MYRAGVSDVSTKSKIVNSLEWTNWDITEIVSMDDAREGHEVILRVCIISVYMQYMQRIY